MVWGLFKGEKRLRSSLHWSLYYLVIPGNVRLWNYLAIFKSKLNCFGIKSTFCFTNWISQTGLTDFVENFQSRTMPAKQILPSYYHRISITLLGSVTPENVCTAKRTYIDVLRRISSTFVWRTFCGKTAWSCRITSIFLSLYTFHAFLHLEHIGAIYLSTSHAQLV
jgi:hypothetical protein